jgi:DNA-binding transcriptional LysR family regulator
MGLGAAILPASAGQAHRATLHVVQIGRPQIRSRPELAWNPAAAANPAARVLIDHARSYVRRLTADPEPAA